MRLRLFAGRNVKWIVFLAALGVVFFAIGSPLGAADPPKLVITSAVQTLQELAHITRGRYFQARDTAALLDACRRIDRLERTDIQSFQYRRYHEAYPWLALASFLLYGLALALDMTLWRRLP